MAKTTIKPLGDNVLIEPLAVKQKTEHGIYLPETSSKEKPQQGKVAAVGDSGDIKVKKGQAVLFRRYSGTEVKVDDKDFIIIKNEDILAIVE